MIELDYFTAGPDQNVYQVIQFRAGEPWRIVDDGELLGSIEKLDGVWQVRGKTVLAADLIDGVGRLIDGQAFNLLPSAMKNRWPDEILEAIAQGDRAYLVVCKEGVHFERFEKVFRAYVPVLVKDEWEICFRVYNARMDADFELFVNSSVVVY